MHLADVYFPKTTFASHSSYSISSKARDWLFASGRFMFLIIFLYVARATVLKNFSWDMNLPLERSIINPNENRKYLAHVLNLPSPCLPTGVRLLLLPLCCDTGWTQGSVSCLMPSEVLLETTKGWFPEKLFNYISPLPHVEMYMILSCFWIFQCETNTGNSLHTQLLFARDRPISIFL